MTKKIMSFLILFSLFSGVVLAHSSDDFFHDFAVAYFSDTCELDYTISLKKAGRDDSIYFISCVW